MTFRYVYAPRTINNVIILQISTSVWDRTLAATTRYAETRRETTRATVNQDLWATRTTG